LSPSSNIIIIGNGVAGITASRIIKEKNPNTKITIFTDENFNYYPRPRLYDVLSGEAKPNDIIMFSEKWYNQKGIKINLNKKIIKINPRKKEIILKNQSKIKYDKLLLANGGRSFIPPIENSTEKGIFTLRSMNDAIKIKKYSEKTKKAIIIGGGILGLEFAFSLKKIGQEVTVIEMASKLLPRQLDAEGAEFLKNYFTDQKIKIILEGKTTKFLGGKKVTGCILNNGQKIEGDLVIICAGMKPNIELAQNAGFKTNRGVIIDKFLRTNINDVFAIGDVAEFQNQVYGIIPAAMEQAKIVASNILKEKSKIYKGTIPTNTLKIVGLDLISIGMINPEKTNFQEIKESNEKLKYYKKLILDRGKIVGVILLGNKKGETILRKLMTQKKDVSNYKDSILQNDFDLKKLLIK
jgi:nitrite reductase (NADH) large subunit